MRHLKILLTVIGAVTVLVLAGNTVALAATGHSFLLGKTNTSKTTTTLVRTKPGAALTVKTRSSANAPFAVNGRGKVANLNADTVDGLDSSVLANRTSVYSFDLNRTGVNSFSLQTATLPAGSYLVSASAELYGGPTVADDSISCSIQAYSPDQQIAWIGPTTPTGLYAITMSGGLRQLTPGRFTLNCSGPTATYKTLSDGPGQISVTRIGQLTMGTATAP
ncbi:MAG TPA: hypothetical protein VFE15_15055 [Marmoricola sp.]|jgi:hypothetical protein|nr:hypothetical protein [Marmoricola sp.]